MQPRNWKEREEDEGDLDFSLPRAADKDDADFDPTLATAAQSRMDVHEEVTYDDEDDAALEEALLGVAPASATSKEPPGFMSSLMSTVKTSIVGKEALSPEDVSKAVTVLQKRLQVGFSAGHVSRKHLQQYSTRVVGGAGTQRFSGRSHQSLRLGRRQLGGPQVGILYRRLGTCALSNGGRDHTRAVPQTQHRHSCRDPGEPGARSAVLDRLCGCQRCRQVDQPGEDCVLAAAAELEGHDRGVRHLPVRASPPSCLLRRTGGVMCQPDALPVHGCALATTRPW